MEEKLTAREKARAPRQGAGGVRVGRIWVTTTTKGNLAVAERIAQNLRVKGGVRIGRVWQTLAKGKRLAVAERLAQYQRQDLRHQRPQETRTAPVRVTL